MLSRFSRVQLCVTLWTAAFQAPLSMGFSRQEYRSCHALLQGIFLTQGSNPHLLCLLHWQVGYLPLVPPWKPANAEDMSSTSGLERFPWRRKWQPTPVFLPGKSHGQRSLAGYSPWGHKESGTTEWLKNNKEPKSGGEKLSPPWNILGKNIMYLGNR